MKNIFRWISLLEGLSYILLLFIAVPLNMVLAMILVKLLGMPHGILFILYLFLAFFLKDRLSVEQNQTAIVFLASIVPFGTFYVDKKFVSS